MVKTDKTYNWGSAKCVRYKEAFDGENHPCYWCGKPPKDMLGPEITWCDTCGGFFCPSCGKCWCNVGEKEFEALKILRNKYCCNWLNFKSGLQDPDRELLQLVPGFEAALNFCRHRKGFGGFSLTRGRPFTIRL